MVASAARIRSRLFAFQSGRRRIYASPADLALFDFPQITLS
jgi:hypothetical protein